MKKILLLGSSEPGKEFVTAAKRAGQYVIACDSYENTSAMQVADKSEVMDMPNGTALDTVVDKHRPDLIISEIETIRTERLFDHKGHGIRVAPSARTVNFTMNRRAIRDPTVRSLGLRTVKYLCTETYNESKAATDKIGFPYVVGPLMSSSERGQSYIHNDGELEEAFKNAMDDACGDVKEVTIEEFTEFGSEFTLPTVTQKNGPTPFCPLTGYIQKGGDYRESWQPCAISKKLLRQAEHTANEVTHALTGYGIWRIEFFLTKKEEVIFSELSLRPHDTGMVVLTHITNFSEFELHSCAIMGLPAPTIHLEHASHSVIILPSIRTGRPLSHDLLDVCNEDKTRLRIFGKPIAHVGRRTGVTLCYGEAGTDMDTLCDKTKRVTAAVLGIDSYTKK